MVPFFTMSLQTRLSDLVRGMGGWCVLFTRITPPPCGYCLKASYDGRAPVIAGLIRNPEGWRGAYNNPTQPTESPSPLMGEESKVRVNKPTPTNTPARHTGLYPSFPRRRESTGQGKQQTNTNHIPRPVILASRQYPQGGGVRRVKQDKTTYRIPSPIKGEG